MINQVKNLKGLLVGCGSIGERHLHNLQKLGIKNIAICDKNKKRVNELAVKYKVKKFYDLDSAMSFEPSFTFICTYPNSHLHIANKCLNFNSHLFIEKPIATSTADVKKMLTRAKSKNLQVAVGYNIRFDKGLFFLKEQLNKSLISKPLTVFSEWGHNIKNWRPGTNYSAHYVLKKGGGIILDDSHEYDYVRWILNDEVKSVYCQTRKLSKIKTETESIAALILTFRKGTIASLIIDYIRPHYERKCHIIGEEGDLKWEYLPKSTGWKNYNAKAYVKMSTRLTNRKIIRKNFLVRSNDMYLDETQNFLDSILNNKKPFVDGWEGLKTLQIGIAALRSAKNNKPVFL